MRQEKWITARTERLLSVRHFHVVFTLPSERRALAQHAPREVFGALFASASEILLELGETRQGARLGVTMVLHTWTRELRFHPHVHALLTAGRLALDGSRWSSSHRKYLFRVEVMGALLRGKMLAALRTLHRRGAFARFSDFDDPEGFDRLMQKLASAKRWIVYEKRPFARVDHVLKYLGRYTHRVGVSNSRFSYVTSEAVTFRTKNGNTVTVTPSLHASTRGSAQNRSLLNSRSLPRNQWTFQGLELYAKLSETAASLLMPLRGWGGE